MLKRNPLTLIILPILIFSLLQIYPVPNVGTYGTAPEIKSFNHDNAELLRHTGHDGEGRYLVAYREGLVAGIRLQRCEDRGIEDARNGFSSRPSLWSNTYADSIPNKYSFSDRAHFLEFDSGVRAGCEIKYTDGYLSVRQTTTQQPRERTSSSSSSSSSDDIDDCLADLAFGGHYATQVVTLRHYRDDIIGATPAGKVVVGVLTSWYYSFSPSIAEAEAGNPLFKQAVKMTLYPLVAILYVSEKAFYITDDEQTSSAISQLMAASLVGMTYFAPMVVIARKGLGRSEDGPNKKIMVVAVSAVMMTAMGSMMVQNTTAYTISTILMAFATLSASTIAGAYLFPKIYTKINGFR